MADAADLKTEKMPKQRGFSLIEAIAAIALIALAMPPLLALQQQAARTAFSITRAENVAEAQISAISYFRSINPMMIGEGALQLGEVTVAWRARAVRPEAPVLDAGGGVGRFIVSLYRIEATIRFPDGREASFTVHRLGWRAKEPYGPPR